MMILNSMMIMIAMVILFYDSYDYYERELEEARSH